MAIEAVLWISGAVDGDKYPESDLGRGLVLDVVAKITHYA
jgi:hypothetical protein